MYILCGIQISAVSTIQTRRIPVPFKCCAMLICILFLGFCGLDLFSNCWLYMHVNFHQPMTTFLIAKQETLKKQIFKAFRNQLMQYEFCKLYNLTNWSFRIARLAHWPSSHEPLLRELSGSWIPTHMFWCLPVKVRPFLVRGSAG